MSDSDDAWKSFAGYAIAISPPPWSEALAEWVDRLGPEWTGCNLADLTTQNSPSAEALFIGTWAGYIQQRQNVDAISKELRTSTFQVELTGHFDRNRDIASKIKATWPLAHAYQYDENCDIRLTPNGMKVKLAIESGDPSRRLSVLSDSRYFEPPQVRLRLVGGSPLHGANVAMAQATASVGPTTFAPQINVVVSPAAAAPSVDNVDKPVSTTEKNPPSQEVQDCADYINRERAKIASRKRSKASENALILEHVKDADAVGAMVKALSPKRHGYLIGKRRPVDIVDK